MKLDVPKQCKIALNITLVYTNVLFVGHIIYRRPELHGTRTELGKS